VTLCDLTALGPNVPTLPAMPAFSHPTEGLLIRVLGGRSHGAIGTLLREVDLAQFDPGEGTSKQWINKDKRLKQVFDAARSNDSPSVRQAMLRLVVELVNRHAGDPDAAPDWLDELRERLLADGYELRQEIVEVSGGWPARRQARYRLLPAGAAPAPLAPAISALEAELAQRNYAVALRHYGQAVRNFTNHDLEAANGQLRSFLENLFVQLASAHAGYMGNEPVAALQQLRDKGTLLDGEFDLLRGLWKLSQGRGAHQGLTTAEEALFRLQTTTSAARFLLHHLR
jgi:hypothetical protein